jgi:hypothetical protein
VKIEIPQSITFSEYAKLPYYPEDILEYFGYALEKRAIAHELGEIPHHHVYGRAVSPCAKTAIAINLSKVG